MLKYYIIMFLLLGTGLCRSESQRYAIESVDFVMKSDFPELWYLVIFPEDSDNYIEYEFDKKYLIIKTEDSTDRFEIVEIELIDTGNEENSVYHLLCKDQLENKCRIQLTTLPNGKPTELYQNFDKKGDCPRYIYNIKQ